MKINISLSSSPSVVGDAIVSMLNMRTIAHLHHLSTGSFAAHKALNDFYDGIVGLADRFAESAIGIYGSIANWPTPLTQGLSMSVPAAEYIKQAASHIAEIAPNFSDKKDLDNILAEVIELCNQTVYKLENLK